MMQYIASYAPQYLILHQNESFLGIDALHKVCYNFHKRM